MACLKRICILILILTMASTVLAGEGPGRSARKYLKKGETAYEKADYETARENLKKAIAECPTYAQAWYTMGQVALAEKKTRQAFGHFAKAVENDPGHTAARLALGRLLMAARVPEEAMVHADAILKVQPDHLDAILLKGSALMSQKRAQAAADLLGPLFERGERNENLILLLSSAYFRLGAPGQSETVLNAGIEKFPDSIVLHLQRGNLCLRRGELLKARTAMETVVRLAPDNAANAVALARIYWELDEQEKAGRLLADTLAKQPGDASRRIAVANFYLEKKMNAQAEKLLQAGIAGGDPEATLRLALGELYVKQGDARAAIDLLQKGLGTSATDNTVEQSNLRNALAKIYLAANDPKTAKTHVDAVLATDPDNLPALVTRGSALKASGQAKAAIADFNRVLRRKPDYIDGYVQLAAAHLADRQTEKARRALEQGLRLAPDNRGLLMNTYRVCLRLKDYKQAEAHLGHLVETYPQAIDAQAELGDFYLLLNDESRARREYSEIVLKSPRSAIGHIRLARLYQRQGRIDAALAQLRKGYDVVEPNDGLAAEITGILISAKRYEEALSLNDDRLAKNEDDALAYELKGKINAAMEQFDKARKAFAKAAELAPEWNQPSNDLAGLFILQDRKDKAIDQFERALKRNPNNPMAYLSLGALYEEQGAFDKAKTLYENGVSKVPGFWHAANRLAFLMADQATSMETLDEALAYASAAYRIKPGQATIIDTLGWIHYKKGEYQKALDLYNRLIAATPENPVVNYHMAVVLEKTGDLDAAKTHLEMATRGEGAFVGREQAESMLRTLGSKS